MFGTRRALQHAPESVPLTPVSRRWSQIATTSERKLDALERKYDASFRAVFTAIRKLMAVEAKRRRRIGFGSST
jgi:hypothetical protein